MLKKLLLLFIVVPVVELILLITLGQWLGTLPTIGLIIFTGVLGAYLVKQQGVQVLAQLRAQLRGGQLPAGPLLDGAMVLVAGALLMTPGILTDTIGLLCLIPASRRVIRRFIWSRLERAIRSGRMFSFPFGGSRFRNEPDDVVIIDHDSYT